MPDSDPELHGLDPGELLARAMQTAQPSAGAAAWTPPEPETLAALLPQYRIERLIGHGGMGAVYQGWQPTLDRAVAIYESAQTGAGHFYFVMEYVSGTDLRRILEGPGLNAKQALAITGQICDALAFAHSRGVIHRDIKPANIVLTKDGRAKLADFGLTRPARGPAGGLTQTAMVMGTPDYMAPEQRAGEADQRADIYALGVMLYEMRTGQRPQGIFALPAEKVPVDARIDEVVVKALQQEPARRYQRVSEMKTDVDRIRNTPPGGTRGGTPPGGTRSVVSQTSITTPAPVATTLAARPKPVSAPVAVIATPLPKPAPTAMPPTPMPVVVQTRTPAVAPIPAATPAPTPSRIATLSEQTLNVSAWITSPLETVVPEAIWENMTFLNEALRDEATQKPAASPAAYTLAVRLCDTMVAYLEERKQTTARAGGAVVLHPRSQLTAARRDQLTWPQYFLERDERAERNQRAAAAPRFQSGQAGVVWNVRAQQMRGEMTALYARFREALRQSPKTK